jgi:hypothetical protein
MSRGCNIFAFVASVTLTQARYRKRTFAAAFSLALRPCGYCVGTGASPAATWETALSRIWDALKQAERQRSGKESQTLASDRAPDRARESKDRRRDLRHAHHAPLLVYGSDADKQPFHEEAETLDANADGCLVLLETVVARGQRLFLTNTRTQAEQECRVAHLGKRVGGKTRVGVTFIVPCPEFWRPL